MRIDTVAFDRLPEPALRAWDAILAGGLPDARDVDVTMTREWSTALAASHLRANPPLAAVAWQDDQVAGVFPFFRKTVWSSGVRCRTVEAVPQLYSGRGFLLAWDVDLFAMALLEYFSRAPEPWDWLEITVPAGSPSQRAIESAAARLSCKLRVTSTSRTPYIDFPERWETLFEGLAKKFRWTLRSSRKRMEGAGRLTHRVFTAASEVDQFLTMVFAIERESWKEQSGTSITLSAIQQTFYRGFAEGAARRGWLRGHVLLLDDAPAAYIFGVQIGPVFHDLKESYRLPLSDFSPGHVLKTFAFPCLFEEGVTRYDFRGNCDDFKLKWTQQIYERVTLRVEAGSVRVRAANALGSLKRRGVHAVSKLKSALGNSASVEQN